MDDLTRVSFLKKKEIATLFLICIGQSNAKISLTLEEPDKTTSSRITRLYKKLDVEGKDEEKRLLMMRRYCPIVRQLIKSPDDLKFWIPAYPNEEVKTQNEKIENENPIDDEDGENYISLLPFPSGNLNKSSSPSGDYSSKNTSYSGDDSKTLPDPPEDGSTKPIKKDNTRIVGGAIIIALVLVIVYLLRKPPQNPLIQATQTPDNPPNIVVIPSATFAFTPTHTYTPTFTSTPTETPTFTPTFTPAPEYLFNHSFSDGTIPDTLHKENGDLYIGPSGLTTYGLASFSMGDTTWTDYMVEIYVSGMNNCDKGLDIGVRSSNSANMMMYQVRSCYAKWNKIKNGQWTVLDQTNVTFNTTPERRIEITVKGNQFNALSPIALDGFSNGGLYITMNFDVSIEYIKVTKLP